MRPLLLALLLLTLPTLAAEPDVDGFVSLFNGKDLTGWVPVNVAARTANDTFTVKDGLIVCTGVPTGVLRTEKMYENFIVELEWRHLRPGGNSGFFVWSDALTSKGVPFTRAVENQILDGPGGDGYTTQGDVFAIHGATMTPGNPGKWKGRSYPTENRTKPSPEWNHYRIECNHGAISLAVNGKVVTTAKDVSQRKGYLCLESEGGLINFRNLRIKELPPTENLDPKFVAQKDEGFKSLYTGLDLAGWTTTDQGQLAWRAKDWTLQFDPPKDLKPASPEALILRTDRKLKDFELMLDYRQRAPGDIQLILRGVSIKLPPQAEDKPAWHRLHLALKGADCSFAIDNLPPILNHELPRDPAESTLGLNPTGLTDFANLYLKPLP
jgi:hypothetical protein